MILHYLSVCSGIEAATQAWHPLGWQPVAFSEIEPFPCAVLAHHYPTVPNWGDMTRFQEWPDADVDVLCGGTPCQSFSVAGLRQGLADPRGNLMLTFGAIAGRYRPRWLVWENVPGVLSSNGGRDFGAFLGMLGQLGYGFAYRVLDAQHVRTCRFPRAVPQRRRRVFVVGYLGDWRRAAAVLFDRESLSGHPAPRREARESVAPTISARPTGGGGLGTDFDLDGGLIAADVAPTMRAGGNKTGGDRPPGTDVDTVESLVVSNSGDIGYCLTASAQQSLDAETETLIAVGHAFDWQSGGDARGLDPKPTAQLQRGQTPAVAWSIMPQNSGKDYKARAVDVAQPIMAGGPTGGNQGGDYIQHPWAVRRLTPRECERLQGFPDDFSRIPYRNKPADQCPDGPRYKALGNSWAVNVAEWVGERIAEVDAWELAA